MYDDGLHFCKSPESDEDNALSNKDNETADDLDNADEFEDDRTLQLEARAMEEDDELEIASAAEIIVCDNYSLYFLN